MRHSQNTAIDRALGALVPLINPPEGVLPDPEQVAALGEDRLPPAEVKALVALIRQSPAARVEFRALYPQRFAALFETPEPAVGEAKVFSFRRLSGPAIGGITLAVAAAAAILLVPCQAPVDGRISVYPETEFSVFRGNTRPGERFRVMLRAGRISTFDRLRGGTPWAALVLQPPSGEMRVICTTEEPTNCGSADGTLSHLFVVPNVTGTHRFIMLSGPRALPLDTLRTLIEHDKNLRDLAAQHHWSIQVGDSIQVQ